MLDKKIQHDIPYTHICVECEKPLYWTIDINHKPKLRFWSVCCGQTYYFMNHDYQLVKITPPVKYSKTVLSLLAIILTIASFILTITFLPTDEA